MMLERFRIRIASVFEALDEWATRPDRFKARLEALRAEKKRRDER